MSISLVPGVSTLQNLKHFDFFFNLKIVFYSKLSSGMFNTFYLIENKHSNQFFFFKTCDWH